MSLLLRSKEDRSHHLVELEIVIGDDGKPHITEECRERIRALGYEIFTDSHGQDLLFRPS